MSTPPPLPAPPPPPTPSPPSAPPVPSAPPIPSAPPAPSTPPPHAPRRAPRRAGRLGQAVTGLGHLLAARALLRHCPEPESWLDVATGDARFPRTARRLFPYTSFDGLDPTDRVLRARTAEHVEEAYVGRLTDPHLADWLRARYDVVSLLRPDRGPGPRAELRAALRVLRPGGHLLVAVTAPHGPFPFPLPSATRSAARLRAELREAGCTLLTPAGARRVIARAPAQPRSTSA